MLQLDIVISASELKDWEKQETRLKKKKLLRFSIENKSDEEVTELSKSLYPR